jgi:hypothetical protein
MKNNTEIPLLKDTKRVIWFRGGGLCARVEFNYIPTREDIEKTGNDLSKGLTKTKSLVG